MAQTFWPVDYVQIPNVDFYDAGGVYSDIDPNSYSAKPAGANAVVLFIASRDNTYVRTKGKTATAAAITTDRRYLHQAVVPLGTSDLIEITGDDTATDIYIIGYMDGTWFDVDAGYPALGGTQSFTTEDVSAHVPVGTTALVLDTGAVQGLSRPGSAVEYGDKVECGDTIVDVVSQEVRIRLANGDGAIKGYLTDGYTSAFDPVQSFTPTITPAANNDWYDYGVTNANAVGVFSIVTPNVMPYNECALSRPKGSTATPSDTNYFVGLDSDGYACMLTGLDANGVAQYRITEDTVTGVSVLGWFDTGASASVTITDASDEQFNDGESVTITGTGFGATAGRVVISDVDDISGVGGTAVEMAVTNWDAGGTSVTATMVRGTFAWNTGLYLFVEDSGGVSNASGYSVQFVPQVYIRETFVDLSDAAQASEAGLDVMIWRSVPTTPGTPDEYLAAQSLDASGVSAWQITGTGLDPNAADPIWFTVHKADGTALCTMRKITPSYE